MKKYAIVEFLSSKDEGYSQGYTYENKVGAKKYDAVVVPTRYGLSLAVVTKLTDKFETDRGYGCTPPIKAIAEIIESKEVAKVMKQRKAKDLKKELEKKVKELDDIERFKLYANQSPEFAKLLKEYEKVTA